MVRLLQFLLVIALVLWIARAVRELAAPRRDAAPPPFQPTARCAQCGVHVPAGELDARSRCRTCAGRPAS